MLSAGGSRGHLQVHDSVTITNALICEGAVIKEGAIIEPGSVVGFKVLYSTRFSPLGSGRTFTMMHETNSGSCLFDLDVPSLQHFWQEGSVMSSLPVSSGGSVHQAK